MTKRQVIDQITEENPGALPEFLAQFSQEELVTYLACLEQIKQPRLTGDATRYAHHFGDRQVHRRPRMVKKTRHLETPCPAATPPAKHADPGQTRPAATVAPVLAAIAAAEDRVKAAHEHNDRHDRPQAPWREDHASSAVAAAPAATPADTIDQESWLF